MPVPAYTVIVGGVDRTTFVAPKTITIDLGANRRDTLTIDFIDNDSTSAAVRPALRQPIQVINAIGAATVFLGLITSRDGQALSSQAAFFGAKTNVNAASADRWAFQRVIRYGSWEAGTDVETVVQWVVDTYLFHYGVTLAAMPAMTFVGPVTFDGLYVYEAFNQISEDTRLIWFFAGTVLTWIDPTTAIAAPIVITDASKVGLLHISDSQSDDEFRSLQIVRIGGNAVVEVEDTWTSDGEALGFLFTYNHHSNPRGYVTVTPPGGPAQNIGISDGSDDDLFWVNANFLQVPVNLAPLGPPGTTVHMFYNAQFPHDLTAALAGVAAADHVEHIAFAETEYSAAAGQRMADGLIRRFGQSPKTVTILHENLETRPGQVIPISLVQRTIVGDFLVASVRLFQDMHDRLIAEIVAIEGNELLPGHEQFWETLGTGGGGASSVSLGATSSAGTSATPGRIIPLGGSIDTNPVGGATIVPIRHRTYVRGAMFPNKAFTPFVDVQARVGIVWVQIWDDLDNVVSDGASQPVSNTATVTHLTLPTFTFNAIRTYHAVARFATAAENALVQGMLYGV